MPGRLGGLQATTVRQPKMLVVLRRLYQTQRALCQGLWGAVWGRVCVIDYITFLCFISFVFVYVCESLQIIRLGKNHKASIIMLNFCIKND